MSYNISSDLASLPIEMLVAKPLESAVKAQAIAAYTTIQFIQDVGLDEEGNLRTVEITFNRKRVDDNGEPRDEEVQMKVPLLTLVPIPYIRINKVNVDLSFKIRSITVDKTKKSLAVKGSAEGKWPSFSFSIEGSFSSKRSIKTTVDKSAEIDITVEALQDEMPEGMRTVLTMLTEAMLPPEEGGE